MRRPESTRAAVRAYRFVPVLASMVTAGCLPRGPVLDPLPPPIVPNRSADNAPPTDPAEEASRPAPPVRRSRSLARSTIIIDAGHGGKDPGAQGVSTLPEKTIVLDIANDVADRLESLGARVIRTRSDDEFIELEDRARMADRYRATLLVSIHADSAPRRGASGATIYTARSALSQSRMAARRIDASFRENGIECRGVRRADFIVLAQHSRPAVLVECGYLTNPGDARLLNTAEYRSKVAAAIAQGVAEFCSN